ncbi:MAG: N-acetyl-gamma-glutamyl-phosphate reductase [Bacteroidetes bacterium HGW-Bacteroidetes-13]|nr:MAG: N-acetyl-gamma-glutamyl-phosphate reductase [Bacteroidetes bacterium HGW-Bacteroidetes-13]
MLRTLIGLLLLMIISSIVLSIPAVQTYIAKKVTTSVNEKYGTNIKIEKVDLSFLGSIALKEVYIEDYQKDTLIYVKKLNTSLRSAARLMRGEFLFGKVTLEDFVFNMRIYKDNSLSNLDVFVEKLDSGPTNPSDKPFYMSMRSVNLKRGIYRFYDDNLESPEMVNIKSLNAKLTDFVIEGPEVLTNIEKLSFDGFYGLQVENMKGAFSYLRDQIRMDGMELVTANSSLTGDLSLHYQNGSLSDFNNRVRWDFKIADSDISMKDINLYYPEFGDNFRAKLSTHLKGVLNDFVLSDTKLRSNFNSTIEGEIRLRHIFDESIFQMNGDFEELSTNYFELKTLLPNLLGNDLPESTQKLGQVYLYGPVNLIGNDIDFNVELQSALGELLLDAKMIGINNTQTTTYNGTLSSDKFDVGRLIDNQKLGKATMNLTFDGQGFTVSELSVEVFGKVNSLNYNNYDFKNISLNGTFNKSVFNGKMKIEDINLRATFDGLADLSKKNKNYNFNANIEFANLYDTHLYEGDKISVFTGNISANFQGTNIDDFVGDVHFRNTTYGNVKDQYYFKDFSINSSFDKDVHFLRINSKDIVEGELAGKFSLSQLPNLVENALGSFYTNYKPIKVNANQYVDFNFTVYNKLVDAFFPGIFLGRDTYIKGKLIGNQNDFKFTFNSSQVNIYDFQVEGLKLQFDNKNPLYNAYVQAKKINNKDYAIKDFNLVNINARDTLFFKTEFSGGKEYHDRFDLNLYHTINKNNRSVVGFKNSNITFKGNTWNINKENNNLNYVVFNESYNNFRIQQIILKHNKEEISLSGSARDTSYKDIKVGFKDVHLGNITPEIDSLKLDGLVNGSILLLQSDNEYFPTSYLKIDDFEVNKNILGALKINILANDNLSNFDVDASLKNEKFESFAASGKVYYADQNPTVNMDVSLNKLDISALSPFGETVFDRLRGQVSGNAQLTGRLKSPEINGLLTVEKAGMNFPYLKVDLDFPNQGRIVLDKNRFVIDNWKVTDAKYKTNSTLNGSISHLNYSDWRMDLKLNTNRFLVLDTKEEIESLYYGTGFISGIASLRGPFDDLVIDVNAKTEKGTNFYIPISDAASVGDNSFMRFITPEEKEKRKNGLTNTFEELKGLSVNFDLDVTPDAEIEIMVDKENQSTLRGKGVGNLLIELDTNGKFNMWGDFITYSGIYNFKYKRLINKKFVVQQGGTITWDGDPLQAQINIKAVYKTEANPALLLESQVASRKIATEVYINLNGVLTQPDLDFNIEFPNANSQIKSELQFKLDDKEVRNRQAISVISTGAFMNVNNAIGQQIISGNLVSESVSSLVNDLFQDDNSKFNVGLDYVQADSNPEFQTQGRVGVTFQTQINDRILINGKVGVPTGGVSQSVVVGDVQVELLLNEDGTLRAQVFNRQNQIQYIGEQEGYTQGVGISYQVDFDNFKELLKKIFKENKKKKDAALKPKTDKVLPEFIEFKKSND